MTSIIEGFVNEGIVDLLLLTLSNVNGIDQDTNSDSFVYIEGSGQSFIRLLSILKSPHSKVIVTCSREI